MRWIVSYLSAWLGLILISSTSLIFILPASIVVLPALLLPNAYTDLVTLAAVIAYAPIWFVFMISFFFPAVINIALRAWKGILTIEYLTPAIVVGILVEQFAVLKGDLLRLRRMVRG